MTQHLLQLSNVAKSFTLHNQNGVTLNVLEEVNFCVDAGECVVLDGPSGMGKSTLLKLIYANYRATRGNIILNRHACPPIDLTQAKARELIQLRKSAIGYVSQFLRVIPRVSALDVVAEPLTEDTDNTAAVIKHARDQAAQWLTRLRIPERLWDLPPATFSGGEQQRINIARSMIKPRVLLLLDEPTASLDPDNTQTVIEMIQETVAAGTAAIGIFHDQKVGNSVATRHISLDTFRKQT
ncbi:MAG: phosphonate C-P lyase system protein PhnL [Sheuella sp.]|jgi:alpha-D-ribose 1-methylphosphonate 5-triphosphate synthase subunit PhnL|nr:phosphonate C-P lyase system protein PhnL [Sheuella sp.]